ncbi:DUF4132 domain-containing protein [Anatilimnocola floriformis]|uniref:DUF4132 domain-containing protein n=1 Tax=Anatilimnocola floriformis TaxID=2948575 RepID=UPI0020C4CE92|nr:DUF4132 domain-containing protein [Anatilimnocola floriformis]
MYRNPAALSADSIVTLEKILEPMRKQDREIADRLMKYIIDGDEESVLNKMWEAGKDLRLGALEQYGFQADPISWQTFFRDLTNFDIELFQRFIKVFEAAVCNAPKDRFLLQKWLGNSRGLEVLLQEANRITGQFYTTDRKPANFPFPLIEQLLKEAGADIDKYLHGIFEFDEKRPWDSQVRKQLRLGMQGLGPVLAERRSLVVPYLLEGHVISRVSALETLIDANVPLAVFVEELATCATESSKQVRDAAWPVLRKVSDEARPHVERLAREGDRNQREHAIRLLGRFYGEQTLPLLRELLETEKSAPVREVLQAALGEVKTATAEPLVLEVPPLPPLDLHAPVTPALRQAIEAIAGGHEKQRAIHNEKFNNPAANPHLHPNHRLESLPKDWVDAVCAILAGKREPAAQSHGYLQEAGLYGGYLKGDITAAHQRLLENPDLQLIQLVRWLVVIHAIPLSGRKAVESQAIDSIEKYRATHSPPITLAELGAAVEAVGADSGSLLQLSLYEYWQAFDWEAEAVWPYLYANLAALERSFIPVQTTDYQTRYESEWQRAGAFRLLRKFPVVPPAIVGKVWELAISTNKHERQQAQPIAARLPDLQERLATALSSGSFQTRQNAAEWIGRLGDKVAIKPLVVAAKNEKQDATFDTMLTALERLGESISPFLDREKLQADAQKNLAKGLPTALVFFPFDTLPGVRWQDSGKPVPTETLIWLIVQSFKLKTAEPGALLKRYCELFRKNDREEFGNFVLQAWLGQDLKRGLTDDEARAKAKKNAPQQWQYYQHSIQWYQNNKQPIPAGFPQSQSALEDQLFAQYQREVGSAVAEKGMLAVAGACCGDAAVGPVQRYLKEWYGYRAAQCKALIAMLSGVDRPLAIQYILSISNRFRTKGIREEAEKYIQLLAERKGWSLDELADRTMPTCGLDDEGKLELDFGPRKFLLRVNADLELTVYDAEGKALKKLPDPRKDDDAELAKAAKKTYSVAKTEVKKLFGLTQTRLYEAMCTERTWPLADWELYLHQHPLVRFLVQRLVWAVLVDGEVVQTFRPLDDGSFTDFEDNPVTPPAGSSIRVAHACNVSPETTQAWAQHLSDYDVTPLFAQFARAPYELPAAKQKTTSADDFQGHLVEAFKLRGLATKFGYTRGQAEDGGWFYSYSKAFPGLGIEVLLSFSGNGLPEENRTVALTTMSFARKSPGRDSGYNRAGNLQLKDVPSVLLAECLGDMKTIAAAGSGFDAEWEKRL